MYEYEIRNGVSRDGRTLPWNRPTEFSSYVEAELGGHYPEGKESWRKKPTKCKIAARHTPVKRTAAPASPAP